MCALCSKSEEDAVLELETAKLHHTKALKNEVAKATAAQRKLETEVAKVGILG